MTRVYLCDDEPDYRQLLREVLTAEQDIDIVGESRDGVECIAGAAAARPDVILLDVKMPGMSGMEALPEIRNAVPDASVVMLTTSNPKDSEAEALEHGATALIQKPLSIFDVPTLLREALAGLDDAA